MKKVAAGLLILVLLFIPSFCVMGYEDDEVIGTVETIQYATNDYKNLYSEMQLCNITADAVKDACDADIAIVNGDDFWHNLEGGRATWSDIKFVFEGNADKKLAVCEITGADLFQILEYSVSHDVVNTKTETLDTEQSRFDGHAHISGFKYSYDPTAPQGERIISAELNDGTVIRAGMTLKLAATEYMLSGGFGYPSFSYETENITLAQALADYFYNGTLTAAGTGRVTVVGLSDRFSISGPVIAVAVIAVILMAFAFAKIRINDKTRKKSYEESFNNEISNHGD